ncbi:MAG TPA: hypothetical protein VGZ00_12855 [Candidatus Baltobacteraceae bacterium]|jgi:hypothetical protein|nr:hypothetical protein [Candidatus Baltobacteraceae bacterium]
MSVVINVPTVISSQPGDEKDRFTRLFASQAGNATAQRAKVFLDEAGVSTLSALEEIISSINFSGKDRNAVDTWIDVADALRHVRRQTNAANSRSWGIADRICLALTENVSIDKKRRAKASLFRAKIAHRSGRSHEVEGHVRQAFELNPHDAYSYIWASRFLGRFPDRRMESLRLAIRALTLAEEGDDRELLVRALLQRTRATRGPEQTVYGRETVRVAKEFGDLKLMCDALIACARSMRGSEQVAYGLDALRIASEICDPRKECEALIVMARGAHGQKQTEYLITADNIARRIKDRSFREQVRGIMGSSRKL